MSKRKATSGSGEDMRPLLVAVDFSEDSAAALAWALTHATATGAPVIALHVVHDLAEAPGFYTRPGKSALEPQEVVAEEMMEEFLAQFFASRPDLSRSATLRTRLVTGLPPNRIIEVAENEDAALIAMGTEGRGGIPGLLIGSVAEKVLQDAVIPVVVVKAPRDAAE